ncbi:MAG TPA: acetate--CoA ligase [Fimbriimonadaceae bacterium]|nr:acetate--CoA ligase [Fimbriimonadaceae bacterium]
MPKTIDTLLDESRTFAPAPDFAAQANISDPDIYERAARDPEAFWESWAKKLDWFEPWHTICDFQPPFAKWFVGGKLNAAYNCVDRHANGDRAGKTALLWEGEPGEIREFTYRELLAEVSKTANALKELGVAKGDRVCIYMPMVPELAIAMLACARIGAAHSVVFGGFSAESLHERTNDAKAKVIVTADGGWRRAGVIPLQKITAQALELGCPTVEKVLILQRIGHAAAIPEGPTGPDRKPKIQDQESSEWVWWHDIVPRQSEDCPCEAMDSEDLLFILYTSGSTGKPKGITHTTGGYLVGTYATSQWVFDLKEDDVYWCTADCGWVTGHSYIVYGPLANGATCVMYEGAPDTPNKDRFWKIVERHRVTILYTAPTAIRTFMKWGVSFPESCDLSSLRLLGTVGEPINPEAWIWYHRHIGGERCPIVDTWWQTETGAIMITPLPGITETKPGSATQPFPGISAAIYNEHGEDITPSHVVGSNNRGAGRHGEVGGFLVLTGPWPSMTRGIYGDPQRFKDIYWSKFPGRYFAGDGAKVDEEGYFWLLGRVDDIMLVAGHNISTMEVESALVDHPSVAEAAVIGKQHELKGQAIAAFVTLKAGSHAEIDELKTHVAKKIGALARPDDVIFAAELPKTRSGKIMRRLLRDVAEGRVLGDTTTLADPAVVNALKSHYEDKEG